MQGYKYHQHLTFLPSALNTAPADKIREGSRKVLAPGCPAGTAPSWAALEGRGKVTESHSRPRETGIFGLWLVSLNEAACNCFTKYSGGFMLRRCTRKEQ